MRAADGHSGLPRRQERNLQWSSGAAATTKDTHAPAARDAAARSSPPPQKNKTKNKQVAQFQAEYQAAFSAGDPGAARLRLIWALAHHAQSRAHVRRALDLATSALDAAPPAPAAAEPRGRAPHPPADDEDRELRYLSAVALYNLGRYLDCRRACAALLERHPGASRQAEALKAAADDQVVKEGLLGLGVLGAVSAVVVGLVVSATSARRR